MNEFLLDALPNVFSEVFGVNGFTHGSKSDVSMGMHDGNNGIQWNIDIKRVSKICRLGVNLEGLKYNNWPIASFLLYEKKKLELFKVLKDLNDKTIIITILRDAWQVTARPPIEERIIGGKEVSAEEITEEKWISILHEALLCLNPKKGYEGRAIQTITFLNGTKREMEVSPHLYIYKVMENNRLTTRNDIISTILKCKKDLDPIHQVILKITKQDQIN